MLVSFERTLFYLMVVAITKTVSLDHNRNQKYRDGEQKSNHEPKFYKDTRHKRFPMCRSSAHLLPHGMSVSRPGRLGEGSLASPGEADRYKEVVHIPCPKRMSSNSRAAAALKGSQQEFSASSITQKDHLFRVAKDSRRCQELSPSLKSNQNPGQSIDLNQAVKQNQQWFISNLGSAQPQSTQNYNNQLPSANPTQYCNDQHNRPTANANQHQAIPDNYNMGQSSGNYAVIPIDRPFETNKGSQKHVNTNKYDHPSAQQHIDNRRIKMKFEENHADSFPQTHQMAGSNGEYLKPQIQKPQDAGPNTRLDQLPPMSYATKTPSALPQSRNEIVLPGVQESNRYLSNTYNITNEAPSRVFHTMDSPNQLPPYSNSSHNELTPVNQQAFYLHNFPNNTNRGVNYGFKPSNATMPNGPPLNYDYNSAREQGTANQQQNTCKHDSSRQSFNGEMDVNNAVNVNDNQPNSQGQLEINEGSHVDVKGIHNQQYQESQKVKSGAENWKDFNKPQSESTHEKSQINGLTVSSQVSNKDKTGNNQVNAEKPVHGLAAIKGFFGKHNKDEVKGRQQAGNEPKPPKSKGHNENLLPSPANNAPTGNTNEIADYGYVGKNERALINGKSGVIVVVEKSDGFDKDKNNGCSRTQNNGMMKNYHKNENQMDVVDMSDGHQDTQASMGAPAQLQMIGNGNLPTDTQNYKVAEIFPQKKQGNVSRSMSHMLNPPVTVEPHLFTNKGLRVVSKVPYNGQDTYHPFMGFAPARNDEAFYDKKNMNFLGPIAHPPLINLKRNKFEKAEKHMKTINKHFKSVPAGRYRDKFCSEPADFHSDMIDEDSPQLRKCSKGARHARKCHQNHKTFWQHLKGQDKRGMHRSKVSSYRSGPLLPGGKGGASMLSGSSCSRKN